MLLSTIGGAASPALANVWGSATGESGSAAATLPASQLQSRSVGGSKHEEDRRELIQLIKRQSERIEKLKLDSAVQLEHRATLRKLEFESLKESTARSIAALTPQVEMIRAQWSQAREASSGYEVQWGAMRSQLQQMRARIDALSEQSEALSASNNRSSQSIKELRDQLHRLSRDKANLRQKVKSALEALVTDDEVIQRRLQEEEVYRNQMTQALTSMRVEYTEAQRDCEEELAPMRDDVQVLNRYLEEMQVRTSALEKYCIDLELKLGQAERKWVEDVHEVYGGLEQANQRVLIKGLVLSALEQQLREKRDEKVRPRNSNGQADTLWLSNSLAVWESVIKKEINQQKQKMQMREDGAQLLAQTSQLTERTRAQLESLKGRVEGDGYERRLLLHEISSLHFLLQEKKMNEEQMMHFIQDACTQLDENLTMVLGYIRRDGFDDYVSSTDEDEDDDAVNGFAPLAEEATEDDVAGTLVSSLDLDPDDPNYHERLRAMSRRSQGPLIEFARRKAEWLKSAAAAGGSQPGGVRRTHAGLLPTLDRAVAQVQTNLCNEAIAFVRNRYHQIQQGHLDPRNERLNADPKYVERMRAFHNRVEAFVQQQKDLPLGSRGQIAADGGALISSSGTGASHGTGGPQRIVVDGARLPAEVLRGNPITKASFYATNAIRGAQLLVILRRTMVPQLRSVFVSRDLTKIVARRPDVARTGDPSRRSDASDSDDTMFIRLADVSDIVLGHRTDVFREARMASRHIAKEERAFSIVSASTGATLDIECDSVDDRNLWATIFAWVVNESRMGGVLHVLSKAGKLAVVDTLNQTPNSVEVQDRQYLNVRITP